MKKAICGQVAPIEDLSHVPDPTDVHECALYLGHSGSHKCKLDQLSWSSRLEYYENECDLTAIEARCNAATPGPWDYDICDGITQHWSREKPWLDVVVMEGFDSSSGCNHRIELSREDGDFIAHAREDVPALIERVRELEALINRYES